MTKPTNIVVKRMGAVGDVIMTTAVIDELYRRHTVPSGVGGSYETPLPPNITVVTENMEVFLNNPSVQNVLPSFEYINQDELSGIDLLINLDDAYEYGNFESYSDAYYHRAFGELPNRMCYDPTPKLYPTDDDKLFVESVLHEHGIDDKFIVVHMRHWFWNAKNISLRIWNEVFEKLYSKRIDFNILCVGGASDYFLDAPPLVYDFRGKFTIQQLHYLMERSVCFVGPDSAPYHCAVSTGKAIGLFTHLSPNSLYGYNEMFQPPRYQIESLVMKTCGNCYFRQQKPVKTIVCDTNDYRCTDMFNTDEIVEKVLFLFDSND